MSADAFALSAITASITTLKPRSGGWLKAYPLTSGAFLKPIGQDILTSGGPGLVHSLIKLNLIDEYRPLVYLKESPQTCVLNHVPLERLISPQYQR